MYSDGIPQVEEASEKEWTRCGCTITCTRIKRREKTSQGGLATTGECSGTGKVKRYSNDTKEGQNTSSSKARHGATTKGVTFKTPKKARDEGSIEGQLKDKILARDKDKEIGIQTKHENGANPRSKGNVKGVEDGRYDRRKREELKIIEKMCRINPPKEDTEKSESDEEVERVMGSLTQEE